MDGGMQHDHGMAPPGGSNNMNNGAMQEEMVMHMNFYWSKKAIILFKGWPGTSTGMYVLALIIVFVVAVLIEWLSHSQLLRKGSGRISAGLVQSLLHTIRVGLSYLVMLSVMSFNIGVFLVAVAGHSVGFLVFGSRVFKPETEVGEYGGKQNDLRPLTC